MYVLNVQQFRLLACARRVLRTGCATCFLATAEARSYSLYTPEGGAIPFDGPGKVGVVRSLSVYSLLHATQHGEPTLKLETSKH